MAQLVAAVSATVKRWKVDEIPDARYVKAGDEVVEVLTRYPSRGVIRVLRGAEDSTAASHDAGTALESPLMGGASDVVQAVLSRTTTLTNAQIKALPTTGIEVVPAPGANKAICFIHALLHTDMAVAYEDVSPTGTLALEQDGQSLSTILSDGDLGTVMGYTDGPITIQLAPSIRTADPNRQNRMAVTDNAPIFLRATQGGVDFTGGDAANRLVIQVVYTVADLV